MHLDEESVERLLNAPHGMAAALENRCNWLGSSRPNLFKMAFMSQMTGLDNSALLPPYFPAFRGEDMLFGATVEAMHHRAVVLEYPWSVPHLPLEQRQHSVRSAIAGKGGIALFARYLTENIDYRDASDPAGRLKHLAADARRIALRADQDLLLDYRRELAKGHADQLHVLQTQLARAEALASANWSGYLKRGIEELQLALSEAHSPTQITGVKPTAREEDVLEKFRDYAFKWADLLEIWPAVRQAASEFAH
jgi:hypothetical protein